MGRASTSEEIVCKRGLSLALCSSTLLSVNIGFVILAVQIITFHLFSDSVHCAVFSVQGELKLCIRRASAFNSIAGIVKD